MKKFAQIFPLYVADAEFDTLDPSGFREIEAGPHRLEFEDKLSRFVTGGEFDLVDGNEVIPVKLEVLLRFHMYGIGYSHPTWGHGMWKGEEDFTSEHWNVGDIDLQAPHFQHVQQVIRVTSGAKVGHGVLEQAVYGDHHQYRFEGFTDPL